jgi:hypothetical protein
MKRVYTKLFVKHQVFTMGSVLGMLTGMYFSALFVNEKITIIAQ